MAVTATRSARRAARCVWWRLCGLGTLICALALVACMALRVRRRLPDVSAWEEARLHMVSAPGIRRFGTYLQRHAEFEEYCRHRTPARRS